MRTFSITLGVTMALATPLRAENAREVVGGLLAALQAGDAYAVAAAFTEDAGYAYSLDGDLNRGESFDSWLASDITGPGSAFVIETATVVDGRVDAGVLWGRDGDLNRPARYIFTVEGNRIDSWRITRR